MKPRSYLGALALVPLLAASASAQATLGVEAAPYSSYVWRGVSLSSNLVVQPGAYLTFPVGRMGLRFGGWANVEPGKYDDPLNDVSQGGGTSSMNLTEVRLSSELNRSAANMNVAAGVLAYLYPNDSVAAFNKDANSVEIFGKVGLKTVLSPSLALYYDLDKVKGAYLEGSVSHSIPVTPTFPLQLGALAGFSAGQAVDTSAAGERANFFENGLTHVDLSASTSFAAGPLSIAPQLHFVIANDEATKYTSFNDQDNGSKIWFGAMISWATKLGARR